MTMSDNEILLSLLIRSCKSNTIRTNLNKSNYVSVYLCIIISLRPILETYLLFDEIEGCAFM